MRHIHRLMSKIQIIALSKILSDMGTQWCKLDTEGAHKLKGTS